MAEARAAGDEPGECPELLGTARVKLSLAMALLSSHHRNVGSSQGSHGGAGGISLAGRGREEEAPLVGILWMEESTGEVECRGLRCKEDEWLHTFTVVC